MERGGRGLPSFRIDSTYLEAAASPLKKGGLSRGIGRTKGGLNSKRHVVCDDIGKPLVVLLMEGRMSDHKERVWCLTLCRPLLRLLQIAATTPIGSAPS